MFLHLKLLKLIEWTLPLDDAQYLVKELLDYVKEVDGVFISLWHNETLCDNRHWKGWRQVYEYTIEEALR